MMIKDAEWLDTAEWLDADFEDDTEWIIESADSAGDHLEALRSALSEQWQNASPEALDALLQEVTRGMTLEEAENFWKTLGNIGRQIAPVAGQVLGVAAPIVGGAIGGPVGAALGGVAGRFAGQALGSFGRPGPSNAPARPAPRTAPRSAAPVPPGGSSATAQLLSFLQNPQLLQSILGQLMGAAGRGAQPVGASGASAPFGAFMNTLSVLANQAASESVADSESTTYMYDEQGHLLGDPASPEERAAVLLQQLRASPVRFA
jgi:hypothetical protein